MNTVDTIDEERQMLSVDDRFFKSTFPDLTPVGKSCGVGMARLWMKSTLWRGFQWSYWIYKRMGASFIRWTLRELLPTVMAWTHEKLVEGHEMKAFSLLGDASPVFDRPMNLEPRTLDSRLWRGPLKFEQNSRFSKAEMSKHGPHAENSKMWDYLATKSIIVCESTMIQN